MKIKFNIALSVIFSIFYILSFSIISFEFFTNLKNNSSFFMLTAFTFILLLVFLFSANYFIKRNIDFFSKNYNLILKLFCLIYFFAIIFIASSLRFIPSGDMSAIYNNAIELVEQGTIAKINYPTTAADYFYYFPNNLGACYLLSVFFGIGSFFEYTDYFFIGCFLNAILLVLTIYFSSKICEVLFSKKEGLLILLFYIIMPSFIFSSAAFYTDFLSILFPVLSFYIYLNLEKFNDKKKKTLVYTAFSITISLGLLIKFTSIIMLIAIIISNLLFKKYKQTMLIILYSAVCFLIINSAFTLTTNKQLDENLSYQLNTPYTHWIMMGLSGEGRYNPDDYNFTRSFTDVEERNTAINSEILNRMDNLGVDGLYNLWKSKMKIAFSDGTLGLSDFLDDSPQNSSPFHKFILYSSPNYNIYKAICDASFLLILIINIALSIYLLLSKNHLHKAITLLISQVGIMLFLSIWEVTQRYITNFVPIFIIGATGIFYFINCKKQNKKAM